MNDLVLWLQVCELGIKACTAQDLGLFASRLVGLGLNELKPEASRS